MRKGTILQANTAERALGAVLKEYVGLCHYCGCDTFRYLRGKRPQGKPRQARHQAFKDTATRDHIIPKCKGGKGMRHNTVLACFACNQAKADKNLEVFLETRKIVDKDTGIEAIHLDQCAGLP